MDSKATDSKGALRGRDGVRALVNPHLPPVLANIVFGYLFQRGRRRLMQFVYRLRSLRRLAKYEYLHTVAKDAFATGNIEHFGRLVLSYTTVLKEWADGTIQYATWTGKPEWKKKQAEHLANAVAPFLQTDDLKAVIMSPGGEELARNCIMYRYSYRADSYALKQQIETMRHKKNGTFFEIPMVAAWPEVRNNRTLDDNVAEIRRLIAEKKRR